ncbi:class I SAM-dependent methyltransferase [Paenibacillus daejeonensis]|uniref:class I SAM-dependent methyltransferase n=1 Tax=Paenibacillus daejeonensis TaxID=135193 RepID=UPI00035D7386|nr:class I SAM-dependent methyltransferase [Paenibacillus daejeonensis]
MSNHDEIYRNEAGQYDAMVARQPQLDQVLAGIRGINGLDVVDLGAGTGRLSRYLASASSSYTATDLSPAMLEVLAAKAAADGYGARIKTVVADHRELPLPDASADLVVSGWSLGYLMNAELPEWQDNLDQVLAEIQRILRPGGSVIILETLGTGVLEPVRLDFLAPYYEALETRFGFSHQAIRLDYTFDRVAEAEQACGFFFGDWLAERIVHHQWSVVPEYCGIWWKHDRK